MFEDTPVWMVAKNKGTDEKYKATLVGWYNADDKEYLTRRTFGTAHEAEEWLKEFWNAVWQLSL